MELSDQALALIDVPSKVQTTERYRVRFAQDATDVDAALKLRFEVFNLELGEGFASSFDTQRDEDPFDAYCHHLIVQEKETGQVVGTYRMQSYEMAQAGIGFYSEGEYDLSELPNAVLAQSIEVGRACIDRAHRNSKVLFLLWRGLAMYMTTMQKRYLFGCCSLTSQDMREGQRVLGYLKQRGYVHAQYHVLPHMGFDCQGYPPAVSGEVDLPALFRIYLDYRAKVCSPPAIDRLFGTVDFLVMLDLEDLDPRVYRLYFG